MYIKQFTLIISAVRLAMHIAVFINSKNKSVICADIDQWAKMLNNDDLCNRKSSTLRKFCQLMTFFPPFRNLFYMRCDHGRFLLQLLCPPLKSLEIFADNCGEGLFIQHGFASTISADSIGSNCWINQHVVIGYANNDRDRPTIGNNVKISCGAKILGKVKIGDNVTVGPNSVVISDVPAGVSVFGVPARIVWGSV